MANCANFEPAKGRMPVLQFMAPSELAIDPSYQRSIEGSDSKRLIAQIAKHWNWGLCHPLVVSRRSEGAHFVIDGQHRLAAAKSRGDIAHLPCVVGDYESASAEAADFVELNQRRRPLVKVDLFRAAVAAGDAQALKIDTAITDAGLSVAPHMTSIGWKPGMIGNIGGIETACKLYGEATAFAALKVLASAFDGQVIRYAGTIYPGIAALLGKQGSTSVGNERLARALRQQGQDSLRRDILITATDPDFSRNDASAAVISRLFDRSRPIPVARVTDPVAVSPLTRVTPVDRFDMREQGQAQFCDQCDQLRNKTAIARCASRWCSLRDVNG